MFSDSQLLPGDISAMREFDALFLQHRQRIYHIAYRILGNCSDAEDVTQETFTRAWISFCRFDATGSFEAWVFRIAINQCFTHYRYRRSRREISLEVLAVTGQASLDEGRRFGDSTFDPARCLLANTLREEMQNAIAALPHTYRITLLLLEQQHSYAEIGRMLDCPIGTVRSRVHRLRALMRQSLQSRSNG